jgi:predicted aminopeptidase
MPESVSLSARINWFKNNAARRLAVLGVLCLMALSSACSELQYYRQSAGGQLDIVQRRQAIDSLVADHNQDAQFRERLARVKALRTFAIQELGLPDTGSYTQYADLGRDYAVLGLYAAPEFSIELKTWCYPVVGCAAYRGYFDRPMLATYAEELRQQDYETYIAVVPAYSTLGWFDDPVLNTVLQWSEPQMAGLIFHELAHQQLYVKGDTVFNESFATAVQRAGVERWLKVHNNQAAIERYRDYWHQRQQVVDLIMKTRNELDGLYQREIPEDEMRQAKRVLLEGMQEQYRELRRTMSTDPGYDAWFAGELNNAKLGSIAAYHAYVEAFLALLAKHNGNYPAFYTEAARIGALSPDRREVVLAQIQ